MFTVTHRTHLNDSHMFYVEQENARNKNRALSKPKGAPKDKLSHYRVAPFYYFQVEVIGVLPARPKPGLLVGISYRRCLYAKL